MDIQLIGGFHVVWGGCAVPEERWGRPGSRRLLKALALARSTGVRPDRLAALLRPRAAPVAVAGTL
ncbi:hypothetical protein [Streptomyces sp. LN500]|uniref:hypothetical protein n=1 Tax=Streptomyces sp. LN500 TaxID=3112978 RepID=UPI00371FFC48